MTPERTSDPALVLHWYRRRWITWLAVALAIQGLMLWILLVTGSCGMGQGGRLGVMWLDSKSYLDPIESLLSGQGYQPDFRMPGYGVVYMLVRLVTQPPLAFDVLVVLQLIVSAISTCVLARLTLALTGSRLAFILTFFIYAITISVHYYDVTLLTESLCTSLLILSLDRLLVYHRSGKAVMLLWAGSWITWATFMRPVLGAVLVFAAMSIIVASWGSRALLRHLVLLVLPWLVADGLWIARNRSVHGTFIPLTRTMWIGYSVPDLKLKVYEFIRTIGGDFTWWGDPHAEMRFFNAGDDQVPGHTNADEVTLPGYIYTADFNEDSLRAVSRDILALKGTSLSDDQRSEREALISAKLDRYARSFIETHPFHYHVTARLRMLGIYLKQTGIPFAFARSFSELPVYLKAVKLFYALLHYALLAGALVGALLLWRSGLHRPFVVALVPLVIFAFLIFPVGMRYTEHRFLVPFIPVLLLVAVCGIHTWWRGVIRAD